MNYNTNKFWKLAQYKNIEPYRIWDNEGDQIVEFTDGSSKEDVERALKSLDPKCLKYLQNTYKFAQPVNSEEYNANSYIVEKYKLNNWINALKKDCKVLVNN